MYELIKAIYDLIKEVHKLTVVVSESIQYDANGDFVEVKNLNGDVEMVIPNTNTRDDEQAPTTYLDGTPIA